MNNKVLEKFGFPNNIIKEYNNWYWLLRPEQVTLGSSILITKTHYINYSDLPKEYFCEFEKIVKEVEITLFKSFKYNKINYLMLMMNDPTVHYHVIPRYNSSVKFQNNEYYDFGWPGFPDFSSAILENRDKQLMIVNKIKKNL